jgi:S1-C subfamily serine protease
MKKTAFQSIIALCALSTLFFTVSIMGVSAQESVSLTGEDMVALTKPAVVRIAQHVKGTATIPALKIDFKDWSVAVDASRPPQIIPIDDTFSGSGFIVSSDGYIVTNAHVISLTTTKIDLITNAVLPTMYDSALSLNEEEATKMFADESAAFEFSKKVFKYVSEHSTFDVTQDIVVLNPSSQREKFDELMTDGFPVRVVSINDRFYEDDKDVALIKIDQQNLPSLPLGNSQNLNVGRKISIFGFPATAEFNQRNPLESTFTQGVISALKDSEKKEFKVFQTDAKVSEGSSGGPLTDDEGNVLGIITFQTDQFQKDSGDNFAFAIPIEMAQTMLEENHVALATSAYRSSFIQGLSLLRARHCLDALAVFDALQDVSAAFNMRRYILPYSDRCQASIDSGQSIDTLQSRIKNVLKDISPGTLFASGIAALFGLSLICVIGWLIREVNKEEREIRVLEGRLREEDVQIHKDREMIEGLLKEKKRL